MKRFLFKEKGNVSASLSNSTPVIQELNDRRRLGNVHGVCAILFMLLISLTVA